MKIFLMVLGMLFCLGGWGIIIYALVRNQREARQSPLVDDTNFIPRLAAIWEVVAHPERAATWLRVTPDGEITEVFPAIGQDLSEQTGIQEDDGKVS